MTVAYNTHCNSKRLNEMKKKSRGFPPGGGIFWFECHCGYRWEGSSQRSKDVAHRLHRKLCDTSLLANARCRPVWVQRETMTAVVDECVDKLKKELVSSEQSRRPQEARPTNQAADATPSTPSRTQTRALRRFDAEGGVSSRVLVCCEQLGIGQTPTPRIWNRDAPPSGH